MERNLPYVPLTTESHINTTWLPNAIGSPNQPVTLRLVEGGGRGGWRQATQSQVPRLAEGLQDLSH